jgi:hypothetical protein
VGERTADGAPVAHLRVPDVAGGFGEQRDVACEHVVVLDVVVAGETADRDAVSRVAHVGEIAQTPDVDKDRRGREPQLMSGRSE